MRHQTGRQRHVRLLRRGIDLRQLENMRGIARPSCAIGRRRLARALNREGLLIGTAIEQKLPSTMVMAELKICWPSASLRKEVPRAMAAPLMAPSRWPMRPEATRRS